MKICFLTNELSIKHGWGRYSISIIKEVIKNPEIDFCVLTSNRAHNIFLPEAKLYPILPPLFQTRTEKIFSLIGNYKKIRKKLQNTDIVHSLIEPYAPIVYLAQIKKPFIVTLHGTYAVNPFKKRFLKKIYSASYKRARQIICVSKFTQKEFLKKINLPQTLVINNGIDYNKFQDFDIILSQNAKNILSVGALTKRKGYHISIPAVAKVKRKYPNLKYWIVGSQENKSYFEILKKIVAENHLEDNVFFLMNLSEKELINLYHQADIFLMTPVNDENIFEGFGLVYLEANACGKPVIGAYNCGAEDAIKENYNGLLVPQNNIELTSQAILKIFDNPELSAHMSQNGRKWAQNHDWNKVFASYLNLYRNVFNYYS